MHIVSAKSPVSFVRRAPSRIRRGKAVGCGARVTRANRARNGADTQKEQRRPVSPLDASLTETSIKGRLRGEPLSLTEHDGAAINLDLWLLEGNR
jgi:hypothetical protein